MEQDVADRHVVDLGRRIELVSMDRWLPDITIALYRSGDPPHATVHSYSTRTGTEERLAWLTLAMAELGGLEADVSARRVSFRCGAWHDLAIRRTFLEACKVDPALPLQPRAREVDDPRSSQHIRVSSLGNGAYRVESTGGAGGETTRAAAIAAGLAKLLELDIEPGDTATVRFACGAAHDELVGLLLMRAINVRAALREFEAAASRGILVAPSAQEATAT